MTEQLNWFALRIMWIFSPVAAIVAIAAAVDGQFDMAAIVAALAAVMAVAGYRTRGHWTRP